MSIKKLKMEKFSTKGAAGGPMLRLKDMLLLGVTFASMAAGVLLPGLCAPFQPYPIVCMMLLLFLSFLSVRAADVRDEILRGWKRIGWFLSYRLVLLPIAVALLFRAVWPEYGLAALLLTGVSTGAVASFFSILLQANTGFVLVMTVASSLLVPFTLPPLVALLFGQAMDLSVASMMRLLALVVFVPAACAEVLKRLSPKAAGCLVARQFGISLALFGTTNLGIFSQFSEFFFRNPQILWLSTGVAFLLAGIYLTAGIGAAMRWPLPDQLAAAISLGIMNNILVIVFSAHFFTPLEPTTAAVYAVPYWLLVLPLRVWREWRLKRAREHASPQAK
jgi:bile acid:Na+ symporter, BASS family